MSDYLVEELFKLISQNFFVIILYATLYVTLTDWMKVTHLVAFPILGTRAIYNTIIMWFVSYNICCPLLLLKKSFTKYLTVSQYAPYYLIHLLFSLDAIRAKRKINTDGKQESQFSMLRRVFSLRNFFLFLFLIDLLEGEEYMTEVSVPW